jgi:DNA-binding IclR family transcriptional regulator
MVLHVFIAGREGRTITTADLCELTGTWRPLTIRYIEMLFERGLIDRDVSADKPDAWALSLTPVTEARLQELLCSFWRSIRGVPEAGEAN